MNSPLPQPALSLPQVAARSLLLPAVGVLLAFVVHRLVIPHVDEYFAGIALDVGVNIMLAVSLTIVNGFTGQFSIGHAGFMALGAYTAGTITYYGSILLWNTPQFAGGALSLSSERMIADGLFARGDLLFLAGCVAGAAVAGIAGLVVGLPSLRLRGDYLAIVTLGFGEIVRILLEQSNEQLVLEKLPENPTPLQLEQHATMLAKIQDVGFPDLLLYAGSAKGFGDVPNYASAFWVMVFVTFTLAVAFRLKNSSHGRALLAIRENEVAASAMGVPVTRYKVIAFVISAALTGLAGGLYAHQVRLIPGTLGFQKSFDILIMVVLGGLGSVSGSVVAAILITLLPEILRDPPAAWPVVLATLVVLAFGRFWKILLTFTALVMVHYLVDLVPPRLMPAPPFWWPPVLAGLLAFMIHRRKKALIAMVAMVAAYYVAVWLRMTLPVPLRETAALTVLGWIESTPIALVPFLPVFIVISVGRLFLDRWKECRAIVALAAMISTWEVLRGMGVRLSEYRMILYALALILMMILRPKGLLGMSEFADYWRAWRRRRNQRAS